MREVQVILSVPDSIDEVKVRRAVSNAVGVTVISIGDMRIVRRSVDCRQRFIRVLLTIQFVLKGEKFTDSVYQEPIYQDVSRLQRRVVIVGAGPAGLFAALRLIEQGVKPIVLERGKDVSSRKTDIAHLNRNEGLNEESNYCFGEGGAGTFSDGKLFSRSKKRGNMQRVMELFHYFGADDKILYESHAHIGSNRLPSIIRRIRETIEHYGGEIHFEKKVTDLLLEGNRVVGVKTDKEAYNGDAVILGIGHSAHDTYRMLAQKGVKLEAKGFAMGVRVEHKQNLINDIMYHLNTTEKMRQASTAEQPSTIDILGNAAYSLVTQVDGRGVYSFCMCPGGHIVPAGSDKSGCVVNGMSNSQRNSQWANSGIVVEIKVDDILNYGKQQKGSSDALWGLQMQEDLERLAKENGGQMAQAPAQRLKDFVDGCASKNLPQCSYLPGIVASRLDLWLPKYIGDRLRKGFIDFDKKYKGFLTNDAVIVGVESRTSSPIRILRDKDTLESVNIRGLYPVGEGAGYAGGITSSAMDGIKAAESICMRD